MPTYAKGSRPISVSLPKSRTGAIDPYAQVPTMCRCRKTDCAGPYGVRFSRPVRPEHSFGV